MGNDLIIKYKIKLNVGMGSNGLPESIKYM